MPYNYENVQHSNNHTPPSLFELCKRIFYEILSNMANDINDKITNSPPYLYTENTNAKSINNLGKNLEDLNINSNYEADLNGNYESPLRNSYFDVYLQNSRQNTFVIADLFEKHYTFLPYFIKSDLANGPVSRCENVMCKKPVFESACLEFCIQ